MAKASIDEIYQLLLKNYGQQGWWPLYNKDTVRIEYYKGDYSFPKNEEHSFEISVGAILAQNTSWNNAQKALMNLQEKQMLNKKSLTDISPDQLASLILSSGYHNQKARKIKAFAAFLNSGKEMTREHLLDVWGIGPETADSILLYAYRQPFFVVDAYTTRIFSRLGLRKEEISYKELQELFHNNLPHNPALFNEYHALLVQHAKQHCQKKPICKGCPLLDGCTYGLKNSH